MNFALTGAAGYIAPRHLQAIKDTGNTLVAALDPNDSVGILDRYFPNAQFFTEAEAFEQYLFELKGTDKHVDYVSICAPNHLHYPHMHMALRAGAHAICEKPLVLDAADLDKLQALEQETGKRIYTLLQLRFHDAILKLREQYKDSDHVHNIDLTYITSRGNWYLKSWKGNLDKSGGLASNIGIHFFDMLLWIFGDVKENIVTLREESSMRGQLKLAHANVNWFLSVDSSNLPPEIAASGQRTFRSISVDGNELEFSGGFTDLHTKVYEETLKGNGFGIAEARAAIELAGEIRTKALV